MGINTTLLDRSRANRRTRTTRFWSALLFLIGCGLQEALVAQQPSFSPSTMNPAVDIPPAEQAEILFFLQQHGGGVVLSESFMQQIIYQDTTDEGPLREQILGADVVGTQSTRARTTFDFVSQADHAEWFVHLRGTTHNCTTSRTPQAMIRSEGEYHFQLSKQVDFEREVLVTRSPAAFMETRMRNLVAHTPADRIPLVGPLVGMAAFVEAEKRRPLAERIAAFRLTERIAPEFNSQMDESLARLNEQLKFARDRWPSSLGPLPGLVSRSTDHLGVMAFSSPVSQSQATPLWSQATPENGLTVVLSQTRLNQILRVLPIAGQEVRDTDLDLVIKRLSGRSVESTGPDLPGGDPPPTSLATLIMDLEQPLTVEFGENETVVELRAGLRLALGGNVPSQRIRFHITREFNDQTLTLKLGLEEILPVDPNLSQPTHDVVRQVLKQQIESRLQPVTIPHTLPLPEKLRKPNLQQMRISALDTRTGWLTMQLIPTN